MSFPKKWANLMIILDPKLYRNLDTLSLGIFQIKKLDYQSCFWDNLKLRGECNWQCEESLTYLKIIINSKQRSDLGF
jgi:hypothetical protein